MKDHISHRACSICPPCEARDACSAAGEDFPNKLISVSGWKVAEPGRLGVSTVMGTYVLFGIPEKTSKLCNSDALTKEAERKQEGYVFFERFRYKPKD
jgi:hypothetical protein